MKLTSEVRTYSFYPNWDNFKSVQGSLRNAGFGLEENHTRDSQYVDIYSNPTEANRATPFSIKEQLKLGVINFGNSYGFIEINTHKGEPAKKLDALVASLEL